MERSWKCPVIRLDPADNIVVARQPIAAGTFIPEEGITVKTDIPIGHKIASRAISCGEPVWKYNTVIGYASRDVTTTRWRCSLPRNSTPFSAMYAPTGRWVPGTVSVSSCAATVLPQ